ncbi:hypothetical protein MAPG_04151 [Magnaporthiopsis poae ATCC 64411]|uniref:Uncharacterized protein n=1 Tax=Magnaporthiopsis poae (strain ATCC 64411 / 73-15) TaxID=644358 RepID=A0A0C4DVY4_MAGP6|nr:hypothetical protein MAPG_04151 [Magnaporthiopsis poae ATCC 64411]
MLRCSTGMPSPAGLTSLIQPPGKANKEQENGSQNSTAGDRGSRATRFDEAFTAGGLRAPRTRPVDKFCQHIPRMKRQEAVSPAGPRESLEAGRLPGLVLRSHPAPLSLAAASVGGSLCIPASWPGRRPTVPNICRILDPPSLSGSARGGGPVEPKSLAVKGDAEFALQSRNPVTPRSVRSTSANSGVAFSSRTGGTHVLGGHFAQVDGDDTKKAAARGRGGNVLRPVALDPLKMQKAKMGRARTHHVRWWQTKSKKHRFHGRGRQRPYGRNTPSPTSRLVVYESGLDQYGTGTSQVHELAGHSMPRTPQQPALGGNITRPTALRLPRCRRVARRRTRARGASPRVLQYNL